MNMLVGRNDYAAAFDVSMDVAEALKFYEDFYGPQLYRDAGGVYMPGLIGGKSYISKDEMLGKALKCFEKQVEMNRKILKNDCGNQYAKTSLILYMTAINTINTTKGFRVIKLYAGMVPEFEIISTNAPDSVIEANLRFINICEEKGEPIEEPYTIIKSMGYEVNELGSQDTFTTEDVEEMGLDAAFDYYDC